MTKPWVTAVALAALFVALDGFSFIVGLGVFHPGSPSDYWSLMEEILRNEWPRHVLNLVIVVTAAWLLWLAARSSEQLSWPTLVVRALIVYVPVLVVVQAATGVLYFAKDGVPLYLFGIEILG